MQDVRSHAVAGSYVTSLVESAHRAEDWAGEPFLRNDELPEEVLAAGKARRQALDAALAEIEAGRRSPSADWKVKYALVLGLEAGPGQLAAEAGVRHRAAPAPG